MEISVGTNEDIFNSTLNTKKKVYGIHTSV